MESQFIDVWAISCSTGCTCCSYENFDQGFYKTKEEADNQMFEWLNGNNNPLASQYAKYGRYCVYIEKAEILPDGRMIVDGKVYDKDYFGQL